MANFRDSYILGYMYSREKFGGNGLRYLKKKMFFRLFYVLPFLFFSVRVPPSKVIVSGNRNLRFFRGLNSSVAFFGLGISSVYLNIAKLYLSVFLYSFVSRRFVFFFRRTLLQYRRCFAESSVEVVFVHSDGLPLVRALMLAAKPIGIQFVCVQHGYFHKPNFGYLDGSLCHLNVVASQQQLKVFEQSGIRNAVVNKGISSHLECSTTDRQVKGVCLVSSGLGLEFESKHIVESSFFKTVSISAHKAGLSVKYRPHPRERSSAKWILSNFIRYGKSYFKYNPEYVYIGGHSSFLRELASSGYRVIVVDTVSSYCQHDMPPLDAVDLSTLVDYVADRFEGAKFLTSDFCCIYNVGQIVSDYLYRD